jgi:hypothetical protein
MPTISCKRAFCVGDIIAVFAETYLVSPGGREGMWRILSFMVDGYLPEHECHKVTERCQRSLRKQFPGLATKRLDTQIGVLYINLLGVENEKERRRIAQDWLNGYFQDNDRRLLVGVE